MLSPRRLCQFVLSLTVLLPFTFAPSGFADDYTNPPSQPTVTILGDSLTAGFGVMEEEAFPALIETLSEAEGRHVRVVAAGVSGDTSAGGLRRIDWLLRQTSDAFIIELGANDGLRGLPTTELEKNLTAIIHKIKTAQPKAMIILAAMDLPPSMGERYRSQFKESFSNVAAREGVKLMPFFLQGVAGVAKLNQSDGIHPTPDGHRIIAQTVWTFLKTEMKR